jgi:hypothetical protein
MCPFCFVTVGLIVASAISTGGVAALAAKVHFKKKLTEENTSNAKERKSENVSPHNG